VTPVTEVDRRPVGEGGLGPITAEIQRLYFEVVRGKNAKYAHWCTPCYQPSGRQAPKVKA
jgi:branched-chain amino acid aminotransferase